MELLSRFILETVNLWLEISFYLLIGIFFAGVLDAFIDKDFIIGHLGSGGPRSIIKGTLLGVPLPVCSCGVIPLAASLKKEGAHRSSVLSFLVSTPTTGIDSILATYSLMGPLFAIFRPLGAIISGIVLGILDYFGGAKQEKKKQPEHKHKKVNFSFKLRRMRGYIFNEIPQDIGKWLIIGTLIGGLISAVMPSNFLDQHLPFPWDFLVIILISVPLYVCATGSIPIAISLISKGFTPGAGLVFLIAGPATNAITLSFVRAKLGRRSFYLYIFSIIGVSVLLGLGFNYLWAMLGQPSQLIMGAGKILPMSWKVVSGAALILLILVSFFKKKEQLIDPDFQIKVSDLHCKHCKTALERKIKMQKGIEKVLVNLDQKIVEVKGKAKREDIKKTIRDEGYHPE